MARKAQNKDEWEALPKWVVLNSRMSGMFNDSELSGLYLAQWDSTEPDGSGIKNWGHVPKDNDCSRIKAALDVGILFPSNPKGESRHIPPPIIKKGSMDELMSLGRRELIAAVEQVTDAKLLENMSEWEMERPQKQRRTQLLQAISSRLKSDAVIGIKYKAEPAMIKDSKTGKMVPDVIGIQ